GNRSEVERVCGDHVTYKDRDNELTMASLATEFRVAKVANLSEKDIIEMIFFPVVNEACRVLAEGIAVKASDLDIAGVMGMGFPPYRGGVLFWADLLGSKYIYSKLEEWSNQYGGFFKPCAYMSEMAAKGAPLSSGPMGQTKSRL
ncbi:Glyoxysomal fatty acid beta-oxidation multifunctional protein MFP-a, partial [Bienertia sinuspersici]